MNVQAFIGDWGQLFDNGIKRSAGQMAYAPPGTHLNLGSGRYPLAGDDVINLDLPEWRAPFLDFGDGSVAAVHMYHFLEHLDPDTALQQLAEIQRVLRPTGVCYIAVPHAMCPLAYQAPDHKSFWTEEGLQDTFYSAGYDTTFGGKPWEMDISFMMVAGVKWVNMCVLAQLVKASSDGTRYPSPWRRDND